MKVKFYTRRQCQHLLPKMLLLFVLLILGNLSYAQGIQVTGSVTSVEGDPLIGASVVVEGTTNGAIADFDGKFSLNAPKNAVLIISSVGYTSQKVTLNGQTVINVKLAADIKTLGEVVVIGYGTQRKETVTGSVASIGGEELNQVASSNITQALQGRVSGVELSANSSKPGAAMQIRIRGTRSLNASNDPLIVLDGIPFGGTIGDINPSDIKSLDILKDASATAIYGSRGANGVILITTTKGKKGQKPRISYSGYQGIKTVFAKYPMMSGEKLSKLRADAGVYSTNGLDEVAGTNTDWQDLMYSSAMTTSHDLSVSGGTEKGNYKFGLGYYKDESVLPSEDYSRLSLRSSIDQEINDYISVGFTSNNSYSVTNNGRGIYSILSASPLVNPYNTDGSFKRMFSMPADDAWTETRSTLEALGDKSINQSRGVSSYNSVYAEVKIPGVEGLKFRTNVGLNFNQGNGGSYTGEGVFSTNPSTLSSATVSNSRGTGWTSENLLTYDRVFAEKHRINVVALYSAEKSTYNRSHMTVKGVTSDAFQFYNLGNASETPVIDPGQQWYSVTGLQSYMARLMYSYDDKYMVTASYRTDASSRLADGHKSVSYPAISVGWNIHNESFMKNVSVVNSLKLRVGYGIASNQSIDAYSTLGRLATRPYNFGTTYTTGYYVSELPNPELGWEYSATMNYGVDFSLLNNRLSGTIEYYETQTNDLLFRVGLPQTSGVNNYMANIGKSENKGFELTLSGVILDNYNGWTWDASVNFYSNRNKLLSLSSQQDRDESNWWFKGQPIDVIYDFQQEGLWQAGDPYLSVLEPGGNVGMIKVKYTGDYKEDGTPTRAINSSDRQIISMESKFQGGFNTRVAYKGFDLSVVGTFKSGGILIATPYGSNGYLNILTGRRGNLDVDYWTADNTGAKYPKAGGLGGDQPKYLNTLSYFDASFLKIKNISLGYNLENINVLKTAGISKCRFYVTIQNPIVMLSPYHRETGMDPDTNSSANDNAAVGYGYNLRRLLSTGTNTPTTRNYLIGLDLTF